MGTSTPGIRIDPDVLGDLTVQPIPLGDAVRALACAVHAYRRRFEHHTEPWPLINVLVGGRLLTPAPGRLITTDTTT